MEPILPASVAWIVVIGFGLLWLVLGWLFGKKVKTSEDFMVAGRKVGLAVGSATVMATWCTANTVLAAPELGYKAGLWGMIGYGLGGVGVIWFGSVAKRIKELMPKGVSSGEFIQIRYGNSTWVIYMILANVYNLAFLVTQAMGGGLLLNLVFGIPYHIGMLLITTVCVVYTMVGGMKAVVGTDFIQSLMIMTSVVIVIPITISQIGFGNLYGGVMENMPDRFSMIKPLGLMYAFNSAVFSLGEIFHSNLWWVRVHSMREDVVKKGWKAGGLMWMSIPVLAGAAGLIAIATDLQFPQMNMIFPMLSIKYLGGIGAFLIIFVVLGAIYSSLDSLLAGVSSLLVNDIYYKRINKKADDRKIMRMNQFVVLCLGIITASFAWFQPGTMGQMIFFSAAMVCSMIWPIVFGLYSKEPSPQAAIAGMIAGSLAGVYTAVNISSFGAAIASALISLPVFLIVMKFTKSDFDWGSFKVNNQKEVIS